MFLSVHSAKCLSRDMQEFAFRLRALSKELQEYVDQTMPEK